MSRRIEEANETHSFGCHCSTPNNQDSNFFLTRKPNNIAHPPSAKSGKFQIPKHNKISSTIQQKISLKNNKQKNNLQRHDQQILMNQRNIRNSQVSNSSVISSIASSFTRVNHPNAHFHEPVWSVRLAPPQSPNSNIPNMYQQVPQSSINHIQLKYQPVRINSTSPQQIIKFHPQFPPLQPYYNSRLLAQNPRQYEIKKSPSRDTTIVPSNTESQKQIGLHRVAGSQSEISVFKQPPYLPSFDDDLQLQELEKVFASQLGMCPNKNRQDTTHSLMSSSPLTREDFKTPFNFLTRSYRTENELGRRYHRMSEVEEILSMGGSNESNDGDEESIVVGRMAEWGEQETRPNKSRCESFVIFNE